MTINVITAFCWQTEVRCPAHTHRGILHSWRFPTVFPDVVPFSAAGTDILSIDRLIGLKKAQSRWKRHKKVFCISVSPVNATSSPARHKIVVGELFQRFWKMPYLIDIPHKVIPCQVTPLAGCLHLWDDFSGDQEVFIYSLICLQYFQHCLDRGRSGHVKYDMQHTFKQQERQ